jgi:hypothetical protein
VIASSRVRSLVPAAVALALIPLAGCGSPPPAKGAAAGPTALGDESPAARLAARAVLAQDLHYSADYQFSPAGGGRPETVRVARIQGGFSLTLTGPDGQPRRAAVTTASGSFRCDASVCVPGARASRTDEDPVSRLRLVFTSWLRVLADRSAALSISTAQPPTGATGDCFSTQGVAAAMDPPVDPGLYCFDRAGLVTAVQLPAGSLALAGNGPPPTAIELPAPVAQAFPDRPAPSQSASGSPAERTTASPAT